jgi:hypothetical protein
VGAREARFNANTYGFCSFHGTPQGRRGIPRAHGKETGGRPIYLVFIISGIYSTGHFLSICLIH